MTPDEEIGNQIGKLLGCALVVVIAAIALGVYAWQHFRFV